MLVISSHVWSYHYHHDPSMAPPSKGHRILHALQQGLEKRIHHRIDDVGGKAFLRASVALVPAPGQSFRQVLMVIS